MRRPTQTYLPPLSQLFLQITVQNQIRVGRAHACVCLHTRAGSKIISCSVIACWNTAGLERRWETAGCCHGHACRWVWPWGNLKKPTVKKILQAFFFF